NNSASTNGGGISTGGPFTTINNSEFKGNAAGLNAAMPGSGGGLFIGGGAPTLTENTPAGHTATLNGGGPDRQGNVIATLTNVTIDGNTALNSLVMTQGGGIDMPTTFQGTLSLVNATITRNFATIGGGLYWAGNAGVQGVGSLNSLIALNRAATVQDG